MKSNYVSTRFNDLMKMTALIAAISLAPVAAIAGDKAPKEDRSQIGIEAGLELYDRDKADTCVPGALQIRANIHNVTPVGILKVELFGEENFMEKKGKLRRIRVPAAEGPQRVCINLPYPGSYAVVSYHDKDGDRRLDKKWNFKPKEPYGLSNNPKIKSLRLPKYSETGFDVPMEGVEIDINLVT